MKRSSFIKAFAGIILAPRAASEIAVKGQGPKPFNVDEWLSAFSDAERQPVTTFRFYCGSKTYKLLAPLFNHDEDEITKPLC